MENKSFFSRNILLFVAIICFITSILLFNLIITGKESGWFLNFFAGFWFGLFLSLLFVHFKPNFVNYINPFNFVLNRELSWLKKYKELETTIDNIKFELLYKIQDFKKEGKIMQHCVGKKMYYRLVLRKQRVCFRIINLNNKNDRATVDFEVSHKKLKNCYQLKAFRNTKVSEEIRKAVLRFCEIKKIKSSSPDLMDMSQHFNVNMMPFSPCFSGATLSYVHKIKIPLFNNSQ